VIKSAPPGGPYAPTGGWATKGVHPPGGPAIDQSSYSSSSTLYRTGVPHHFCSLARLASCLVNLGLSLGLFEYHKWLHEA